MNAMLPLTKS